jgi:hypothetical protein
VGKLIDELGKDWEWLSFLAKYCAGRNFGKAFCEDVKWWVLGLATLVVLMLVWWMWGRLARAHENWKHRRLVARVADADTMKEYVWAGHDAHLTSVDQRATRKSER